MNILGATVTRAMLPWLIVAAMLALGITGAAGMYGGYEIANARHAKDREAQLQAYADSAFAMKAALIEAVKRGDETSGTFLVALKGIQIVNTTINKEVRTETEKLIYTDCKVPDSGADLLKKNVDSVNMRLVEQRAKK